MKKILLTLMTLTLLTSVSTAQQNSVQIDVNKKVVEPTPMRTSEYADVWLEVTNSGTTDAPNVHLEFLENYPFSADPDEKTRWDLGTLTPGEEYQVHMQVRVDENAVQGENQLRFRTKSGVNNISITHDVPVEVRSDNDIVSVTSVDFPEKIGPGQTESLEMTLSNLADGQLKNIDVQLDLNDLPIATSDTNSRTVTKIEPGSNQEIGFNLNIDENAETGVYKVPVEINYENEAGSEFTRNLEVGVNIGGQPQLEAALNSVEGELTPGSTGTVTVRLVNRGQGSADFVKMALEDQENYEILSAKEVYIGDMEPDDFQTADFEIHVDQDAEEISAPVIISYKNSSGEKIEEQEINVPVYTQQQLERYGLTGGGSPLPVVVVLIILAAGVYYWRKRR